MLSLQLSNILDNLSLLPEDGFRVWDLGYSGLGWLPYIAMKFPVQVCKITLADSFSIMPVGVPGDIVWNRDEAEESLIESLMRAGGRFNASADNPAIKPLLRLGVIKSRGYRYYNLYMELDLVNPFDFDFPHTDEYTDLATYDTDGNPLANVMYVKSGYIYEPFPSSPSSNKYYGVRTVGKGEVLHGANFRQDDALWLARWHTANPLAKAPDGVRALKAHKAAQQPPLNSMSYEVAVPAKPLPAGYGDIVRAVRNMFSDRSGLIDQLALLDFLKQVLQGQEPQTSPDPQPLIEGLIAIKDGTDSDYNPSQIAREALEAYALGHKLTVAINHE